MLSDRDENNGLRLRRLPEQYTKEQTQMAGVSTREQAPAYAAPHPKLGVATRKYVTEFIGAFFLAFAVAVAALTGSVFVPLATLRPVLRRAKRRHQQEPAEQRILRTGDRVHRRGRGLRRRRGLGRRLQSGRRARRSHRRPVRLVDDLGLHPVRARRGRGGGAGVPDAQPRRQVTGPDNHRVPQNGPRVPGRPGVPSKKEKCS
jgi:hypothetical protein